MEAVRVGRVSALQHTKHEMVRVAEAIVRGVRGEITGMSEASRNNLFRVSTSQLVSVI